VSDLKGSHRLFPRDRREGVQELVETMTAFEVVDEVAERNSRAEEHRRPTQNLRVDCGERPAGTNIWSTNASKPGQLESHPAGDLFALRAQRVTWPADVAAAHREHETGEGYHRWQPLAAVTRQELSRALAAEIRNAGVPDEIEDWPVAIVVRGRARRRPSKAPGLGRWRATPGVRGRARDLTVPRAGPPVKMDIGRIPVTMSGGSTATPPGKSTAMRATE
jgi:hypothetical protein